MDQVCKVAIGLVSYKGPHKSCFHEHYQFLGYLGRLSERSRWMSYFGGVDHKNDPLKKLPKLNQAAEDESCELKWGDPVFDFGISVVTGNSLIGQARDIVVRRALEWGADYIFFFDDDMIFPYSTFLKLWRHQKEIVGALAFTAREPIAPVLYKFHRSFNFKRRREDVDIQPIFDYPKDRLFEVDAIGTGVVLIHTSVFKRLSEPWFHGSVGSGEDIHFAFKAQQASIRVFCDTSVKTNHAPNQPTHWMCEEHYLAKQEESRQIFHGELTEAAR